MTDYEQRQHLENLLRTTQERLRVLEVQAAGFGSQFVPAHVVLQINEARAEIANTEAKLRPHQESFTLTQPINDSFHAPLPNPDDRFQIGSEFYIERESDQRLRQSLSSANGSITTIRAQWRTGKSWLLRRELELVQGKLNKTVLIDLKSLEDRCVSRATEEPNIQKFNNFLHGFASFIAAKLALSSTIVDSSWRSKTKNISDKITNFIQNILNSKELKDINKIVLAIDETDDLFNKELQSGFFNLIRSWDTEIANGGIWKKVNIVATISTEPYLLVSGINPSSFDFGSKIYLSDFNVEQVRDLNIRYRNPLDEQGIKNFFDFFGGHPYLTQKAIYTISNQNITPEQLIKIANSNISPFGEHMKGYFALLEQEPHLKSGIRQLLKNKHPREDYYHRLWQIGLVTGYDYKSCVFRCKFYRDYFYSRL